MIGFVLLSLHLVHSINVTEGDDYFLPCPTTDILCYPSCKFIKVTLYKDRPSQFVHNEEVKMFEWVRVKDDVIEEQDGTRYGFDITMRHIMVMESKLEDEGVYRCSIDVLNDKIKSVQTRLTIMVKPTIIGIYPYTNVFQEEINKYVEAVECKVNAGKPVATVTWVGADGSSLPTSRFQQNIRNVGQGGLVNALMVKPTKDLNGKNVFCMVDHPLLKIRYDEPFNFNITCESFFHL